MEISGSLILGVWKNNNINRIKIDNFKLECDTQVLRQEALNKIQTSSDGIELIFRGLICEDGHSLSSYGVTPGATIHILEKKPTVKPVEGRKLSEAEIKQLVLSFKSFKLSRMSTTFRTALQRLSRPEVLENIIAATPGLADDPVAIAIIQDSELLIQMTQPETIAQVAEKHPTLIEAAHYIAAHIHDEQANLNPNQVTTSTGYSYSLDALSDDEDMDVNTPESNREPSSLSMPLPLSRNSSYNAITSAQLAAAIASATNTAFNTNSAGMPDATTSSASSPAPGSSPAVITNEMFTNAMQQAFAFAPLSANTPPSSSSAFPQAPVGPSSAVGGDEQSTSSLTARWWSQLKQMREMGLTNDSINVRALQTTSGDVQAAVDLVFNGVFNSTMD